MGKKKNPILNSFPLVMGKDETANQIFFVFGMHCKACELLIGEILNDANSVLKFDWKKQANGFNNKVLTITFNDGKFKDKKIALDYIKELFKNTSYSFSYEMIQKSNFNWLYLLLGLVIAIVILETFWFLNRLGIINQVSVDANSSLFTFFIFGFLASISSCAVLVGGILLSLTKFWQETGVSKWKAILGFQTGRILAFGILGFGLGLVGEIFKMNLHVNAILLVIVAIFMILAGLNFIGLPVLNWLPKNNWALKLTKNKDNVILGRSKAKNRESRVPKASSFFPILVGIITFFLPCGFTYTTQILALSSGSGLRASLIMLAFVLGTVPILSIIGLTGFASSSTTKKAGKEILNYIIGMLIVIFGLISLNLQFTILGLPSFNLNFSTQNNTTINQDNTNNPQTEEDTIVMFYTKSGLSPSTVKLQTGKTYKIIIDVQTTVYGCMSTIFLSGLDNNIKTLNAGTKIEFNVNADKKGTYNFLCAMGVPHNAKVVIE